MSATKPVLVGALWCLGRAGLTYFAVAARREERAWSSWASATGSCWGTAARFGGCGTAKAEAVMPELWLSVEVVKWSGWSLPARCLSA